ncbi:molybdate ABC transporter substrate-binding protein [uncultured Tateyamaria sp.]|uniref:molybdate ABC transporter substrate-binding protein n=1 Tax=uncultured Tateyamaria sp. TaxID=455651 RepID=UPI00260FBBA3|nr:molybdate ABC transporter substrate-binding protein [uncultured Tateyamaria sp.]
MKTLNRIKGLVLASVMIFVTGATQAEPLRVFAAASLQGPLDAVANSWDSPVVISYGGSGAMARQVSQGAPADVVILANMAWADWLAATGRVPGTPRPLLSNTLVIIEKTGARALPDARAGTLLNRLDGRRLAMGQHMSVPAGIYAKAWLDRVGTWDSLRPHLAETENVRAALALVARGEAPLGIVYASDAAASDQVDVVYSVPADSHPPILYPGLALTPAGAAFLDHVTARIDRFVAAGFSVP